MTLQTTEGNQRLNARRVSSAFSMIADAAALRAIPITKHRARRLVQLARAILLAHPEAVALLPGDYLDENGNIRPAYRPVAPRQPYQVPRDIRWAVVIPLRLISGTADSYLLETVDLMDNNTYYRSRIRRLQQLENVLRTVSGI